MNCGFPPRLVIGILIAAWPALAADSLEARFAAGLRQRGLFELAEEYCSDRLRKLPQQDPAFAELTAELIRTQVQRALNAPLSEQAAIWNRADAAAKAVLSELPPNSRAQFVRFEIASTYLARGEVDVEVLLATNASESKRDGARDELRRATSIFEALAKELKQAIPLRRGSAPRKGEPSAEELSRLAESVAFQLARTNKTRALLYEVGDSDRLSLALAAKTGLTQLLAQLASREPLYADAQLELADIERLLGHYEEAAQILGEVDQEGQPLGKRLCACAVLLRVAIDKNDWEQVARMVGESREPSTGELELTRLQAMLALATANDSRGQMAAAASYYQLSAQQARRLNQTYGPYWGRRANHMLLGELPKSAAAKSAVLEQIADDFSAAGDLDRPAGIYEAGAVEAKANGNEKTAFELSYKAALADQKRGEHLTAAERFRQLAKEANRHPDAAAAHLLAAWNAGQAAKADKKAAALYQELLREHIATWPNSKTAADASNWLQDVRTDGSEEAAEKDLTVREAQLARLVANNRRAEALAGYRELAKEYPDRAAIQQALGRVLIESENRGELAEALERWRLIASRVPPQSAEWFAAKYWVALAQYKLGDKANAATLLRFLLETSRGLKGSEWDEKYRELADRCDK
jgi:hypothetical protein